MNRSPHVALVAAFAAAPAALAPGVLLGFDVTPKVVLVLLSAAAARGCFAEWRPGVQAAWRDRPAAWFLGAILLHAFALIASTAFSTNRGLSFAGSRWRELGLPAELALTILTVTVLGYVWGRAEKRRALLDAVAVAAIPIGAYGIAQTLGFDPLAGLGEWAAGGPSSTFGDAGRFAAWGAPAVFLIAWRAGEERGAGRAWRALSAALLTVGIVLTGEPGALLGLPAGMLLAGGRWMRRISAAAAVAALAFLAFPAGGKPPLWREALRLGLERPVTGHGLETFTAQLSRVAQRFPDRIEEPPPNIFLDAWVAQGLLGTAALAGLCAATLASGRLRAPAGAAFAAALTANQFLSFTAATEAMFLLTAVLTLAPDEGERMESKARPGPALRILGVAATLGLSLFAAKLALGEAAAEATRRHLREGRLAEAVASYRRVRTLAPRGRSYGEWFAPAMRASEGYTPEWAEAALETLEPARAESPARAYALQADLLAEAGRTAAEAALRAAIAAAPAWYEPRWRLAELLRALGREEEALEQAEQADRLAAGARPEVRATLDALRDRR